MIGSIKSLQIGPIKKIRDESGKREDFYTGFVKEPYNYRVWLDVDGLQGDAVGDTQNHGGFDKALLGFGSSNYRHYEQTLGLELPYGGFGENLTFDGFNEEDLCLGDILEIGDVIVEVSQPRQPCWKIDYRWGVNTLLKEVIRCGKTGFYFRVLKEEYLSQGMLVKLQNRPHPKLTIAKINNAMYNTKEHIDLAKKILETGSLADAFKQDLEKNLLKAYAS
jgi:MOSC domain-containing protein YiiM